MTKERLYYIRDNVTDAPFIHPNTALPFVTEDAVVAVCYADILGPPWKVVEWVPSQLLSAPFDDVLIDELATNPGPYTNDNLERDGGWWQRTLDQIDGVTIHHTLSDSPHATAAHYVNKGGGRPTLPYTIWVTQTGEVLLCVALTQGLWHDHTGAHNTHLSIGMAGELHKYRPSDVQLAATVEVCTWAIQSPALSGVTDISQIKGHQDYIATTCPGWDSAASGHWKSDFYTLLSDTLSQ